MFFALATFGGAEQNLRDVQTFFLFWFLLRNSKFLSLAATVRRGNFVVRAARFFVDSTFASSRVGLVLEVCKSWVELVTISKSYGQNKFSIGFINKMYEKTA